MRCWIALIAAAVALFGVEDPWAKVRELKSGTELRIIKRVGPPKPSLTPGSCSRRIPGRWKHSHPWSAYIWM